MSSEAVQPSATCQLRCVQFHAAKSSTARTRRNQRESPLRPKQDQRSQLKAYSSYATMARAGAGRPSRSASEAKAVRGAAARDPPQSAANPRKRRPSSPSAEKDAQKSSAAGQPSLGTLAFDDAGDDGDVLAASDSAGDDEEDESDPEAFPELDVEASADEEDGDDDEGAASFDGSFGSDDLEDELDDEAQLRAELENEQNEIMSASSDDDDIDDDTSDLDELIRRNTRKPVEAEPEVSGIPGRNRALGETGGTDGDDAYQGLQQDYMKRSRTVKSRATGKEKTVWDEEIEPDYASDSSTEEVSRTGLPFFAPIVLTSGTCSRRRTGSATSRNTGTTTCHTSATTSTAKKSCVRRPATNSTAS